MADSAAGGASGVAPAQAPRRRSGPRSRTSPYVGVTQYKRTGRWEAHIWVQQPRAKGFQRHLGSYFSAEDAARCYDRAAIRFRGPAAELNFAYDSYAEDEFMKAHARTEKFKFLDLMRARFAIQTVVQGPAPRARQQPEAAHAVPQPREAPARLRTRAGADSPSPASSGNSPIWRQQQQARSRPLINYEPLIKQEPKAEDDHLLLHNPLASNFMAEPLPAWGTIQSRPLRANEDKQRAEPLLPGDEQRSKVQRTGPAASAPPPGEPYCLSLQFESGQRELVAALPTPAAQLKPAAMSPWDNSADLDDWLSPGDMACWEGGF